MHVDRRLKKNSGSGLEKRFIDFSLGEKPVIAQPSVTSLKNALCYERVFMVPQIFGNIPYLFSCVY